MIITKVAAETVPENWDFADALTETEPFSEWLICCKVDTSGLTVDAEQRFLVALSKIVFFQFKNHVITINDFVNSIQQDAFYELLEEFDLKIIR